MRGGRSALLRALAVAGIVVLSGAGATSAGPVRATGDKVEPRVLDELAARGETTFWVVLGERADTGKARGIQSWEARGRFVYDRLTKVAESSQSGLRSILRKRKVTHRPFWIVNAIRVTAGEAVVKELAAQPEVEEILADRVYRVPKPQPAGTQPGVDSIEWNIARIRAPLAWSTFGVRGEGIVVANIDTGVQFNHPALVRQYRGNRGGTFDHNYSWFDPSRVCGNPSLAPCDNNGHGTHTMGTMVGDDGDPGANQIGVAPGAKWIAAKGCESGSCSLSALLAAGQWILAPTDLNGQNPRPDLRPNVVNNSWGGGGGDTFYQATVDAWVAAGIFPAFSNGNSGPGCGSSGSPGDYTASYSVGAFDSSGVIAGFSSRGASRFGSELKPNIAAPGVSVRSSVPSSSYSSFSGTSMASPHVAGAVALVWSAAPSLVGEIALTRQLLDDTAIDTSDLSCGGTLDDNNVWGEGKLDAFAAVDRSPRGPTGTLAGVVTAVEDASPIEGATVDVTGPSTRTTFTDSAGRYGLRLPVGQYDVTVRVFGRIAQTAVGVTVVQDQTTVRDFALVRAPSQPVTGAVRDAAGSPVANATVTVVGTPLAPARTDAAGAYQFASVPEGTYDVRAEAGRCNTAQTLPLTVAGAPATLDFTLPARSDSFGYSCSIASAALVDATTVLPLSGDDAAVQVALPFVFSLYGQSYGSAYVSTNGFLNFLGLSSSFSNGSIPSAGSPNAAVYALWDDLVVDSLASVRTETVGSAPNRRFVVEWRNVQFFSDSSRRVRFEIVLYEDGRILTQYADVAADAREQGGSATVGIENAAGSVALQYSVNEAAVTDGLAVLYRAGPGLIRGSVTDASTGQPVAGARVATTGPVERSAATDATGRYSIPVPAGTYDVTASAFGFTARTAGGIVVGEGETVVDLALVPAPAQSVSGVVRDAAGAPVANATVTVTETPIAPATTDATGAYRFASVPEGTYVLRAEAGRCNAPQTQSVTVAGTHVTVDFTLPARSDSFGYSCSIASAAFVDATTVLPLSGDDSAVQVALPFPFSFYGQSYSAAYVSTNGFLNFLGPNASYTNGPIPSAGSPNAAVYALWDDLLVDSLASVRTETLGTAPNRRFVVEWRNVAFLVDTARRVRLEIVLHENGEILVQYADVASDTLERGGSATVGIENAAGSVALQYSSGEAAIANGLAVVYRAGPRDTGFVEGVVADGNDGLAVVGATVRALQGSSEVGRATTGADGSYRLEVRVGTYTVEAGAPGYELGSAQVVVETVGQVVRRDFVLATGRAVVSPGSLQFGLGAGGSATQRLSLSNAGGVSLTWQVREASEAGWLGESPTAGTLAAGASTGVDVTASAAGLLPGSYEATLLLSSNSGRQPTIQIPVRLTLTGFTLAVNVGGSAFVDAAGVTWAADQRFRNGGWGFTRPSPTASTTAPIAGTVDDRLYQDARLDRVEYRFETLPAGTYDVELRFAEIQGRAPGQRVFDVVVQGQQIVTLPNHDIAAAVGQLAADVQVLRVRVAGPLEVGFTRRVGDPLLSALRVTQIGP